MSSFSRKSHFLFVSWNFTMKHAQMCQNTFHATGHKWYHKLHYCCFWGFEVVFWCSLKIERDWIVENIGKKCVPLFFQPHLVRNLFTHDGAPVNPDIIVAFGHVCLIFIWVCDITYIGEIVSRLTYTNVSDFLWGSVTN